MSNDQNRNPFPGDGLGSPPSGNNSGAVPAEQKYPVAPPDESMPNPIQDRAQQVDGPDTPSDASIAQTAPNFPQRANGMPREIDPASIRVGGRVLLSVPGKASVSQGAAIARDAAPRPFRNLK